MEMISFDGAPVMRTITQVAWEFGGIDKGTYAHFTIKEINEQVETIVKSGKDQEKRLSKSVSCSNRLRLYTLPEVGLAIIVH